MLIVLCGHFLNDTWWTIGSQQQMWSMKTISGWLLDFLVLCCCIKPGLWCSKSKIHWVQPPKSLVLFLLTLLVYCCYTDKVRLLQIILFCLFSSPAEFKSKVETDPILHSTPTADELSPSSSFNCSQFWNSALWKIETIQNAITDSHTTQTSA